MKTLIIYATVTGNTVKVAKAISKVLKARLVQANKVKIKDIKKYDIIGFGSGIYFYRHHISILKLARKLPSMDKKVFIFSTRGAGPGTLYHWSLRRILWKKGFERIGEFSCKGFDDVGPLKLFGGLNKGRPNKKDVENAKKFAKSLKKLMKKR